MVKIGTDAVARCESAFVSLHSDFDIKTLNPRVEDFRKSLCSRPEGEGKLSNRSTSKSTSVRVHERSPPKS
jgi:hypothetical protein